MTSSNNTSLYANFFITRRVTIKGEKYTVIGDYSQMFSFQNSAIEEILKSRKMSMDMVMVRSMELLIAFQFPI